MAHGGGGLYISQWSWQSNQTKLLISYQHNEMLRTNDTTKKTTVFFGRKTSVIQTNRSTEITLHTHRLQQFTTWTKELLVIHCYCLPRDSPAKKCSLLIPGRNWEHHDARSQHNESALVVFFPLVSSFSIQYWHLLRAVLARWKI